MITLKDFISKSNFYSLFQIFIGNTQHLTYYSKSKPYGDGELYLKIDLKGTDTYPNEYLTYITLNYCRKGDSMITLTDFTGDKLLSHTEANRMLERLLKMLEV